MAFVDSTATQRPQKAAQDSGILSGLTPQRLIAIHEMSRNVKMVFGIDIYCRELIAHLQTSDAYSGGLPPE